MNKKLIQNPPGFIVLLASFCTYISPQNKEVIYLITFAAIVQASISWGISFTRSKWLLNATFAYGIIFLLSITANIYRIDAFPMQLFLYPIVFFFIAGSLWRIFDLTGVSALLALALFFINGTIGLAGSLGLDSLPIFGEINKGRLIFLTSLPSSSGLLWNVNYFAATQAAGFWLLFAIYKNGGLPKHSKYLIYLIGLSVIVGSSRSITVAFIISVLFYVYFSSKIAGRALVATGAVLLALGFGSIYNLILNDEDLYTSLRIYKGLNNRDEIWDVAIEIAKDNLFFGLGSNELVSDSLLSSGAGASTLQNSSLTYLITFGFGGLIFFIAIIARSFYSFFKEAKKTGHAIAITSLLLFLVLDSLVRTYMFGGLGILPLLMCCSIAALARMRANSTVSSGRYANINLPK